MIDFKPITTKNRDIYQRFFSDNIGRGCETSFATLNIWGIHEYAIIHEQLVIFSLYNGHYLYYYPMGDGDKKAVIDAIIEDSKERGIPCCIIALYDDAAQTLKDLYNDTFTIQSDRAAFDYVYDINDLADLQGRKYHKKRTHYNHFRKAFPEYKALPINGDNLLMIKPMLEKWYADRLADNPENDYSSEQKAIENALKNYDELNMEGLILLEHDDKMPYESDMDNNVPAMTNASNRILAVTLGSQLSADTFDVHFEKARWDVDGAYTVINTEFARYIRSKYPHIKYLNREEDMGLEGLRRSKESYYPHHMIEKSIAILNTN